jgi:hypothetical protein
LQVIAVKWRNFDAKWWFVKPEIIRIGTNSDNETGTTTNIRGQSFHAGLIRGGQAIKRDA